MIMKNVAEIASVAGKSNRRIGRRKREPRPARLKN
jgi:hypothetical protein